MKKRNNLLFCLLIISTSVFSQWTWRDPLPQGNALSVIRILNDQSVWAGGEVGTLMHSEDGGVNWDIRNLVEHTKFINFNGLDFPGDSTAYAVDEYGYVYKSTDAGATWDSIYYEIDEYISASCFSDPMNGHMVCSNGKILRTTDGGAIWSAQYVSPQIWLKSVSFPSEQTGYAGGDSCIFKTTDAGATWNIILHDSAKYIKGLVFYTSSNGFAIGNKGLVMKTTDGGAHWSSQSLGDTIFFTSLGQFSADSLLLTGYFEGSWMSYPIKFRSTNGGDTWTQLIPTGNEFIYSDVACQSGGTAYATGGFGTLARTEDYGTTWVTLSHVITPPLTWEPSINGIDFPSEQTGYALTGGLESGVGTILKTIDGGDTWFKLDTSFNAFNMNAIDFITNDIGYICGTNLYSTFDGGASWTCRITGSWDYCYHSVSFNSLQTGVVVGEKGHFMRSTDLGQSWIQVAGIPNINYMAVLFADENTVFAAGPSTLLKSTDAGATWTTISTAYSLQALWFTSPNTGFGVGRDGLIIKTTDGGVSWNKMNSTTTENLWAVHFYDADTGYVAGGTQTISGFVLKTTDGGNTWHEQFIPTWYPLYAIRTTGNSAFTGGVYYYLFGTTNGGINVSAGPEAQHLFINTTVYPNPSSGPVTIRYTLNGVSDVQIMFFDAYGRQIQRPVKLRQGSGIHTLPFPSDGLKPGLYFYTLRVNNQTKTRKVVIR